MSSELILRLEAYPKMRDELERLPPKMLSLSSERKVMPVELDSKLDSRISEVVESIQRAKFTGTGDDKKVPAMYKDYDKIASMLTKSLSLLPASSGWRASRRCRNAAACASGTSTSSRSSTARSPTRSLARASTCWKSACRSRSR